MWIYRVPILLVFVAVFASLFAFCSLAYFLGTRPPSGVTSQDPNYLADSVPSTILGVLALILGFTFSMTISRFEKRRELAIQEANAIGTAYLRSGLLQPPHGEGLQALIRKHLDLRIAFYSAAPGSTEANAISRQTSDQEKKIWETVTTATRKDRGAIESILATAINSMFDIQNERNIALTKTLPSAIYWSILLISAIGLASFNYVRAQRQERGQWQPAILIAVISFVFLLILDLERPLTGRIRITQEALISLKNEIEH